MPENQNLLVPVSSLRFGRDAKPPINIRHANLDEGIEQLAASLLSHGQVYPLIVQKQGAHYFVADGDRRLAAFRHNIKNKSMDAGQVAEVKLVPEGLSAEELSLALASTPLPSHEADRVAAFASIAKADPQKAVANIVKRFGVAAGYVKKILALGNLSPKVIEAWRADALGHDEVRIVQLMTLATIEAQEKALKKLGKKISPWGVQKELGLEGDRETDRQLQFIGIDAYKSAGGQITEDLFGDNHRVEDKALVAELARKKLMASIEELKSAGWSWVDVPENLPSGARYMWRIHEGEKGAKTPAAVKAKTGCIVEIGYDGKLDVRHAVVKGKATSDKSGAKATKGAAKGEPRPEVSNALAERLSKAATLGVQSALETHPSLALAGMLASLTSGFDNYESPIKLSAQGYKPKNADHKGKAPPKFDAALASFLQMDDDELVNSAAYAVRNCVEFRVFNGGSAILSGGRLKFAAAFDAKTLDAALMKAFDASDYFRSAVRERSLAAIEECVNADERRKADKLRGEKLHEAALAAIKGKVWLPPELRAPNYTGIKKAAATKANVKKKK